MYLTWLNELLCNASHIYTCSEISTIGSIALGVHQTWHGEGRSDPLVFELGSHYQMMGTKPAQNFGVVLLNSYLCACTKLHYHGVWPEKTENINTCIVCMLIYISYACVGKHCLYMPLCIIRVMNFEM